MSQQWTTTPPTEPGWYWVAMPGAVGHVRRYWQDDDGKIFSSNKETDKSFERRARKGEHYWLGPLPEPAPPAIDKRR